MHNMAIVCSPHYKCASNTKYQELQRNSMLCLKDHLKSFPGSLQCTCLWWYGTNIRNTKECQCSTKPSVLWYRHLKSVIKVQRCHTLEYAGQSIKHWLYHLKDTDSPLHKKALCRWLTQLTDMRLYSVM